ncbi:hypothetical protein NL676_028608 [Syzygium grande]|nr:hypothetical protein NL676_028608 [Syzygium grande]
MGCGSSKVGIDDGDRLVPSGIRPLLRHQICNNIRIRKRRSEHCSTLSTMQLLPKGCLESSEETSSPDSSHTDTHDHHHAVEDKMVAEANYHDNVANANGVNISSTTLTSSEEEDMTEDKMVVEAVTAAIEEAILVEAEVELEEDDYIIEVLEEERGSLIGYAELDAYPGSPSFRIYCISSISEDDIEQSKDEETDKDRTSQSGDGNAKETSINSISEEGRGTGGKGKRRNKMKKVVAIRGRKRGSSGTGRQQRKVIGKKVGSGGMSVKQFLSLNIRCCYIPTCATAQIDHSTRLLPNNPNTATPHPS